MALRPWKFSFFTARFLSSALSFASGLWTRTRYWFNLDISKYFGSDSTRGGIEFQFRSIKQDAKRQRACADSGGDPKNLGIGAKEKPQEKPQEKRQNILYVFFFAQFPSPKPDFERSIDDRLI
jgi:hypothetical protein